MRIKKVLALFTALALTVALAACGGAVSSGAPAAGGGSSTAAAGSSAAAQPAGGGDGEKITLTVWNAGLSDTDDTGTIAHEDIPFNKYNAKFMEENNVELEITRYNMDQMSQLMTAASMSGDLPDVIILWAGSATNDFSDILLNLEDYMSPDEIDQYSALEICRQGMTSAGNLQALPYGLTTYGAYYNKSVFEQAGITDVPETWDDFIAMGHQLQDAGFIPFLIDNSGYSDTWVMSEFLADELGAAGITGLADGTVKMSDEMTGGLLDQWKRIFDEGLINDDYMSADGAVLEELFVNDKAGIRFNGSWSHKDFVEGMGDNVGVFQIPAVSADAPHKADLVSQPGLNIVVTNQSENPEMAVKYIQYMTSGDFQTEQCILTGDIPSIATADMSKIENPLTVESYSWLTAEGDAVIGFDSIISAESASEFYKNVMLFDSGQTSAKELGDLIDSINLKE